MTSKHPQAMTMSEYQEECESAYASARCWCDGCATDWQDAAEAEMPQEHMVTVVFDVVGATSAEDAAVIVREALRMHEGSHFRAALTDVNAPERFVESWWFPEESDKHVDGNDRPAAHLEWDNED